jgi:hypothetical protein
MAEGVAVNQLINVDRITPNYGRITRIAVTANYGDSLQDRWRRPTLRMTGDGKLEAQAWPGLRAWLCRACRIMSPSAAIAASRCFSGLRTINITAVWSRRRRDAPTRRSGLIA